MLVKLDPMTNEQYVSWLDVAISEYAEDKARVGNETSENALEVSRQKFNELMPDGINTAGTYLFNVVDEKSNQIVGVLWIKIRNQLQEMFIYDIRMDEHFKGQGYGKQTLQALESFVRESGIPKISLHVFGDNEIALKLYRSAGFVETNILMSKSLTN